VWCGILGSDGASVVAFRMVSSSRVLVSVRVFVSR